MVEKYRDFTFKILMIFPLFACLLLIDSWILPQNKINDTIISYSERTISSRKKFSSRKSSYMTCYKFFTKKGYEFSTEKRFVDENDVIIQYSYIFKNITSVKSQKEDYTNKLVSGLNGLNLLLFQCLVLTSIISMMILHLSINGFYNIILSNSFLLFILLYFWGFSN